MKIRNGFVSNSSSSSFCYIGFSVDNVPGMLERLLTAFGHIIEPPESLEEYYYELCPEIQDPMVILGNGENGIPEGEIFIGDAVFYGEDYGLPEGSRPVKKILEPIAEYSKKLAKINPTADDTRTRLFWGERMC